MNKDDLIAKIQDTPFDIKARVNEALEYNFPFRLAHHLWGRSIENHVRNIVIEHPDAELIWKEHPMFKPYDPYEFRGETYAAFISELRNGCQLKYISGKERLYIKAEDRYNEIDLLFRLGEDIIFGEVRYIGITTTKDSRKGRSPLLLENFEHKLEKIEQFFSNPVEYWALMNYEYINDIKEEHYSEDPYLNFVRIGHKLVSIKVDEETREKFYSLLLKKDITIPMTQHDRKTYF